MTLPFHLDHVKEFCSLAISFLSMYFLYFNFNRHYKYISESKGLFFIPYEMLTSDLKVEKKPVSRVMTDRKFRQEQNANLTEEQKAFLERRARLRRQRTGDR